MTDIDILISFFGWCTVINIAILLFTTTFLALFGNFAKKTHARIFKVSENELDLIYFKYLAYYKLAILVFNITPYVALLIIAP